MTYTIRLSINETDSYDGTLRFETENLTEQQRTTITNALSSMTTAMDSIRDIVV